MNDWTGSAELTSQLERQWARGRILGAMVDGASIFPLRLRLRGPTRSDLRCKPALVRFRILDRRLCLHGLSDITVPVQELAELRLGARRAFVTENEINGLAFPELSGSIVIFGMGYRAEQLAGIGWLNDVDVHYWGDIDTHGFGILDRLRGAIPHARSFLMDRATLLAHHELWVTEEGGETRELNRLTEAERVLYEELRGDRYGMKVRLEQERVGFAWMRKALRGLGVAD